MPDNELERVVQVLLANEKKNFVQRILRPDKYPAISLGDKKVGTHLMAWGEADGKYYVYPTIVYRDGKLERLNSRDAWKYAEETGERIEFSSPEGASWFSQKYKLVWPREDQ